MAFIPIAQAASPPKSSQPEFRLALPMKFNPSADSPRKASAVSHAAQPASSCFTCHQMAGRTPNPPSTMPTREAQNSQ